MKDWLQKIGWLISDTIAHIVIVAGAVILVLGVVFAFTKHSKPEQQASLPYSRPHLVFTDEGRECVAWYILEKEHFFVICEGQPPSIIPFSTVNTATHNRTNGHLHL